MARHTKAVLVGAGAAALLVTALLGIRASREAPGPRAIAAASAANAHVTHACELLPQDEIESILAVRPLRPTRSAAGCEYVRTAEAGVPRAAAVVTLHYYRTITREAFETETRSWGALVGEDVVPMNGVGEEALRTGSIGVAAYARGSAVVVHRADATVDVSTMSEIARRAVARFPKAPRDSSTRGGSAHGTRRPRSRRLSE